MYVLEETIRYSDLDDKGRLSLKGLLNLFQDCATNHSGHAGYSVEWLMENHRGWVLTSYQSQMYRMPGIGEKVIVKTVPVNGRGFMGYRLFFLEDEKGNLLSDAYSEWAYVDTQNQKPVRFPIDMIDHYGVEKLPYDKWQGRKIEMIGEPVKRGGFSVPEFLLDTNGHMNNVYYADACLGYLEDKSFNHIRAEFKRSARRGDELSIMEYPDNPNPAFAIFDDEGKVFFTVEFSREND